MFNSKSGDAHSVAQIGAVRDSVVAVFAAYAAELADPLGQTAVRRCADLDDAPARAREAMLTTGAVALVAPFIDAPASFGAVTVTVDHRFGGWEFSFTTPELGTWNVLAPTVVLAAADVLSARHTAMFNARLARSVAARSAEVF